MPMCYMRATPSSGVHAGRKGVALGACECRHAVMCMLPGGSVVGQLHVTVVLGTTHGVRVVLACAHVHRPHRQVPG